MAEGSGAPRDTNEGIQKYYVTKIEELHVSDGCRERFRNVLGIN